MRGRIEAIAESQQVPRFSSGLAERAVVLRAHQPGKRGHAALRTNAADYVAMLSREALQDLEVSGGGFLSPAEHDATFADGDFRKNFSRGGAPSGAASGFTRAPGIGLNCYSTTKLFLLSVVPPALVTAIGPVVAPSGTVARMFPVFSTWKLALTPLKVTAVAPTKCLP
jgi:hypothetical protein